MKQLIANTLCLAFLLPAVHAERVRGRDGQLAQPAVEVDGILPGVDSFQRAKPLQ